ncbi:NADP-dependent oxidoreductase domain-containing protein [Collybia nuda]|uniref:NADP-dependent oxidoreductase domain-containing protein n=1 Tax=Collybia nuda TaxID=64659 RepID=A0A9P6CM96_9AGAR|nr:NADP-dependent oxidoreductase domain-containing protein [Collybia nuda]
MSNDQASKTRVEYRQLGKSGLRVSVPILGTMGFGSPEWGKWVVGEEQSLEVLKAAWDKGINTIDTANVYSNGVSETIVGKFLKKYDIPRERIIIATKCLGIVAHEVSIPTHFHPELRELRDYVNQSGLSRAAIFNAVEASLKRLDTPYIDLLQIHRFDPSTPVEETMKALHDLVEQGKVRYIGGSSMRTWQFAMMNEVADRRGWTKFVSMQNEYSLLYREEEREMNAYCKFNGIGVIPWSPLGGGILARPLDGPETDRILGAKGTPFERILSDADKAIVTRVGEVAEKRGRTRAEVALAWSTGKITSPIVGVSSLKRLEESITTGFVLTEEENKYLEEPYQPKEIRGHL